MCFAISPHRKCSKFRYSGHSRWLINRGQTRGNGQLHGGYARRWIVPVGQLAAGHRFSLYEKQPAFPLSLFLFPNDAPLAFQSDRFREVAKRGRGLSWRLAKVEVPRSSSSSSSSSSRQKTKGAVARPSERASRTHVNVLAIKPCLVARADSFCWRTTSSA